MLARRSLFAAALGAASVLALSVGAQAQETIATAHRLTFAHTFLDLASKLDRSLAELAALVDPVEERAVGTRARAPDIVEDDADHIGTGSGALKAG